MREVRGSIPRISILYLLLLSWQFRESPRPAPRKWRDWSAKELLLLALKDACGFGALVSGRTTDMRRIDVNERITGLERLNPTPRPTTSRFLEGRWNFEWFGSGSPGFFAAGFVFQNLPSSLANLSKMDVFIKDGNAKITANTRLMNSQLSILKDLV